MAESTAAGASGASPAENSPYLDGLETTEEEQRELGDSAKRRLTQKDKRQLAVLGAMDAAVFLFIMVYLWVSGTDPFARVRRNAAFDPSVDYYNVASAFEAAEPNLRQTDYPEGMLPEFRALYSQNNDTVGWLRIEGTGIDGPVVQAADNDTYLRRDFYREPDQRTRLYFADFRNTFGAAADAFSKVTIVYGHHLTEDNRIFAEVENYLDVDYYRARPLIEFDTIYGRTVWKVFACFITAVDDAAETVFYYWDTDVPDDRTAAFCSEILTRSWFINPAVDIAVTDKLLCLSTCTYMIKDDRENRCVLMARMVRPGEKETVDTAAAYENVNRRMPHAWYVQEGLPDPYVRMPVYGAG